MKQINIILCLAVLFCMVGATASAQNSNKEVQKEGWENNKRTVTSTNIYTSFDYVIHYTDGTEERETYKKEWPWTLEATSNWTIEREYMPWMISSILAQSEVISSEKKTSTKDGVTYYWTEQTFKIKAAIDILDEPGGQWTTAAYDEWVATTVTNIMIAKNGRVIGFGLDNIYTQYDKGFDITSYEDIDDKTAIYFEHPISFGYHRLSGNDLCHALQKAVSYGTLLVSNMNSPQIRTERVEPGVIRFTYDKEADK